MTRLAILIAVAALAASPGTARADWTSRDFRVRTVTAHLGGSADSWLEVSGKISREARAAGLEARVTFTFEGSYLCRSLDTPGSTETFPLAGGSRTSSFVVLEVLPLSHTNGGYANWTIRFTFDIPFTVLLCPAGFEAETVTLTSANVTAWAGGTIGAPPPGIPVYSFELGPGSTVVHGGLKPE
jgi:hypothetical protein